MKTRTIAWLIVASLTTINSAFGLAVGDRIKAASGGANVRDVALANVLFIQDGGVHGSITAGPVFATAGGFTGNWWKIRWDSQPPNQGSTEGWSAELVISLAPSAGDIAQPTFSTSFYTTVNVFWQSGFAPASTSPPNPKLGTALGNCTWYAHGRLRQLGYNTTQLNALIGDASLWDNQATANGIPWDSTPSVGAIAQSDSQNHVAVVESVNGDGTITVSESSYVLSTSSTWNFLFRHRTVAASWFQRFIHVSNGPLLPTMSLDYSGTAIPNGDQSPSAAKGTDFGTVNYGSQTSARTFTIRNSGGSALNLTGTPRVQFGGSNPSDFYMVIAQPASPVSASGGSTTFHLVFEPTASSGVRSAIVSIPNNDPNKNPYTFKVQGTAQVQPRVDPALEYNGVEILSGDQNPTVSKGTDFGSMNAGSQSATRTFRFYNYGTVNMSLTGNTVQLSGAQSGDFAIVSMPSSPITPGQYSTISLRFQPSGSGSRNANLLIYFDTTYAIGATSPYTVALKGTGTIPNLPDLTIVEPVTFSPSSVSPGGTVRVDWTERNNGLGNQQSLHNTKIYLSSNPYGTTHQIASYGPMALLLNGNEIPHSDNIVLPVGIPPGDYYVNAFIDCDQQVAEPNEINNIGSSSPSRLTIGTITYTITASAGSGGSISPSGSITKNAGDSQTFTANPEANYVVNQWLVDGAVVQTGGSSHTLSNIQGNRSLQVTFTYVHPGATLAQLTGMAVSNGVFQFTMNGQVGSGFVVQLSSNLTHWTPILTNTVPSGGTRALSEPVPTNSLRRFYRAVPLSQGPLILQPGPEDGQDIWTTSFYSNGTNTVGANGIANETIVVGGWADYYHVYLKFNLTGLPTQASSAVIQLYSFTGWHSGFVNVSMNLDRVTQDWEAIFATTIMKWVDQPAAVNVRTIPAAAKESWYSIDVTDLYNAWQAGTYPNHGIALRPTGNANQWNYFWSSRYMVNPALRPKLVVTP